MANTRSAKKAARQAITRTAVNKSRKSAMRTCVRKVEDALASGNRDAAAAALQAAGPVLMRSAGHGVIHKNTASRRISRLTKRLKALSA